MSIVDDPFGPTFVQRVQATDPAPRRLLGHALVAGVVLEIGLRGGLANAVVVSGVVLTIRSLLADDRLVRRKARGLALLALVPASFLAVWSSLWLAWLNTLASVGLLALAVLHARDGSVFDTGPGVLLRRSGAGLRAGIGRLAIVGSVAPDLSDDQANRIGRVGLGVVVVAPVLLVLTSLLAAADAVFASMLTPDLDVGPVVGHVALTIVCAALVVGAAGAADAEHSPPTRQGRFGVIELVTILGLVSAVLTLFVVSQLVALTDAGDRLVESAGLTPAEYARSGFFQLCWATALLLGFLTLVRSLGDAEALRRRPVIVLGAVVPLLALGLVVVSLRRMALYDEAFGLTMLRLAVVGAAIWMGVVLVMTTARNLGLGAERGWLVAGAGAAGLVILLAANVSNPEALVARHNIERARGGAELDVDYLASMSDDVVPTVVDAIDQEPDAERRADLERALRCDDDVIGVARLNLARERADGERAARCS